MTRRAVRLFALVGMAGLLFACGETARTPEANQEADFMTWKLRDGTEFSAWASGENRADRPTYLWVDLDKGEAWYRVGKAGAWKRMALQTDEDEDGRQTQFGATERLSAGAHSIAFRVAPSGGPGEEFCCVRATVQ